MKKEPTVLIADDHKLFVEGIRRILEPEFQVVGSVGDGRSLVDRVTSSSCPDAILIEIAMPLLNGIEAVRQLRKAGCRSKLVILTMHVDTRFASEALSAGADGFVLKHCAPEELLTSLREVMLGRQYLAAQLADAMLQATRGRVKKSVQKISLTAREREVLQLLAEGMAVKEIGVSLDLSPRTVEFHRYNLTDKLRLKTVAELTRYAVKHGIVAA